MLRLIGPMTMAASLVSPASAPDITGNWQGLLELGGEELRVILQVTKDAVVGWKATSVVVTPAGIPSRFRVGRVTLEGSTLEFAIEEVNGAFEGEVDGHGNSIKGTWIQARRIPLELRRATQATAWHDPSPHSVRFVSVDNGVTLEVLDWGGSGRPLVLLTGIGNDAHIYDNFAPKLTGTCHVYGITRRGFGASSTPDPSIAGAYGADRLGDDVLAVLHALRLERPVLAGHSIAGQELSSIASRHPERAAGLIYMEAGFGPARGPQRSETPIRQAIFAGLRKHTDIRPPVLAIFALPRRTSVSSTDEAALAALAAGVPSARVVGVPGATHYIFQSNEADVLREIKAFLGGLP